jgi:glycerol-3-phosphate dehydrogenase (NAD(P)+)
MKPIGVLGAGSWGTALALHLARAGRRPILWARSAAAAEAIDASRENALYLPGERLPPGLRVTADLEAAVRDAGVVLFVAPAQGSRAVFARAAPHLPPDADLVIASKGIEQGTLLRLSQVLASIVEGGDRSPRVLALSGPSFAAEVARGDPTAVVVAGDDPAATRRVQEGLSHGTFRVYGNSDLVGVELAGALKNVIALATGIAEGIGFGANTRAALITRGLSEIARLGAALGGRPATFAGLAGVGDLILTCTGLLSRNRAVGIAVGRGRPLREVLGEMRMVAEGVATTRAAVALAERHGVDLPIARQVGEVLFADRPPRDAVQELLARPLREEQ